ncbi:ABC-type amino acid transport substrate-binding protein [Arsukibacterium tuosuense]|uniref:ABC-type amino acid transport substrate-binding protein n=1 Tax=Arsukibacterium tuosuense TaxID=1323745 RepID=A0A285ISH7_9GAMM|nr:transporter substrate-binding domain-containing protein [Arsukibacterium tuosuense]SNY50969.1 ABC-type amino acid transport substrate-binding protein [Arsukibacterium tuosuense]
MPFRTLQGLSACLSVNVLLIKVLLITALLLFSGALLAEPLAPCQFSVRVESERQNDAAGSHNDTRVSQQFYTLLDSLAAKVNCTVRPIALPAGRAIKMLEQGELDVMVGMSETAERARFSFFVGPHHSERMVVVASRRIADSVTDLKQLLALDGFISITEGAYYGPEWQQLLLDNPALQARLFAASGNQQKLAMLVSGRVMASLEDEAIVDELLKRDDLSSQYRKLFVIHDNPVYFAFSRQSVNQVLLLQLQQQWQLMQASGEVERIRQQLPTALP